jgi:hypothetical protein
VATAAVVAVTVAAVAGAVVAVMPLSAVAAMAGGRRSEPFQRGTCERFACCRQPRLLGVACGLSARFSELEPLSRQLQPCHA